MIINAHEHAWLGDPKETVPKYLADQPHDISVLLPVGQKYNELVRRWAELEPDHFIPFYWLDLEDIPSDVVRLQEAVKDQGHRGIKFQPLLQHFRHNEPRMYPIYEKCIELGIPVLFHSGVVYFDEHLAHFASPVYVDQVATDLPELNVVIAHLGGNYSFEALVIAEKHENVFMDTAFLPWFCARSLPRVEPMDLIRRALEFVGPDRIMYACEGLEPEVIQCSDLEPEIIEKVMHGNAERLLGLEGE